MALKRPAKNVTRAELALSPPPFVIPKPSRGKKLKGVKYEKRVLDALEKGVEQEGGVLYRSPWLIFDDDFGVNRWCQPDAFLRYPKKHKLYIFEVKLKHTINAWWQLTEMYEPVLRVLFPQDKIFRVEICHWYDADTHIPGGHRLTPKLTDVRMTEMGVLLWA